MTESVSVVIAGLAAGVAVWATLWARRSALWARRAAAGAYTHAAFELARSLHTDLTSGSTAQARDVLEHFRTHTGYRAHARSEVHTVLEAYFALLWCFERILVGRRSLTGQQKWNDTAPAVAFLDGLVAWHLVRWAERWLEIRDALKDPLRIPDLRDHDSLTSFCDLVDDVAGPNPHTVRLRELIRTERARGIGLA
ncbi:hypothetical protein OG897_36605 [Streptomyces sp. NBC_00237]|uniref:hypothetical protein n=1 Tax=Streptomyces sp. NBC_00237 TaxID=2975687 RepID=UPI002250F1F6|nr:hypothetical protein [Streptomyces sp. NBC_00237]MCX5206910.1 hypothetical protein [Streptomyces sp. NBC_00237]